VGEGLCALSTLERKGLKILALVVLLGLGLNHAHAATTTTGSDAGADVVATSISDTTASATAISIEFSPQMLQFPVDVRLFTEGNPLPAGHYRVDLYTNSEWKGRVSVRFEMMPDNDRIAQPCFDLALLDTLGFDPLHLSETHRAALQRGESFCEPLSALFEGSFAHYDSGTLKLNVAAPQLVLKREARGYVDPALWEHGITAGFLDYGYNGYRSQSTWAGSRTSHYVNLRAGFNLGAWRLRYNASVTQTNGAGLHYRGHMAYLERGLPALKSRMTLGDTVTDGKVFDSVRFRGIRMDSDERMRPDSQRGFAPVVRGIAQSNAMVSITQLGREIYQTNVPPGPFVIDDLYPTGIGGDIEVTITESDGSQHTFKIAYTGTTELVRPGATHYTLAAGRHENAGLVTAPLFVMGNLRRGLSNIMTGYTGLMVAEGYSALTGGLALNLPIGALAGDFTFANTRTQREHYRGSSVRATWAKVIPLTGTQVSVASYRYSSSGYYNPAEAFMLRDRVARDIAGGGVFGLARMQKPKNRMVVNASQQLPGRWGYFNLSASSQDYWARDGRDTQYQLGWNRQIVRASLGLSASRTHNVFWQRWDNQYMVNLSMPLGGPGGVYTNTSYTHRDDAQSLNTSVSGTAGERHQFGFGMFVNANALDQAPTQYSGGASASWNASKLQMSGNFSTSRGGNRQYGVSLNGGVVAFGGGIVLTQRLGETIAIIQAKDAEGALVANQSGTVRLNRRGLAIASYLQPYRHNRVALDPKGLSTDVAMASTTRQVAPTAGAIVLLQYETERGYSILLSARHGDGRYLPFAATVSDEDGRHVGHIAQGGQALLRVNATEGALTVRWGTGAEEACRFRYALPPEPKRQRTSANANANANASVHDFRTINAVCLAEGEPEPPSLGSR